MYSFLADIVVVLHFSFVLFVVAGQGLILAGWLRGWRWTTNVYFRTAHLAAIGLVVAEAWFGIVCPLTTLEVVFRERAGWASYEMSFIGYWLHRLLFFTAPEWVFTLLYTLFALVVVTTYIVYPPSSKQ